MSDYEVFVFARVIHVLAVVLWIGGVAFVTCVLIPALKHLADDALQGGEITNKIDLFETLEGRFSLQAKITTLLAGASGFYMLDYMDAWQRYADLSFWWLHAMTLVWLLFSVVLFVLEPLILHQLFRQQALKDSRRTFVFLHVMHIVLLSLSLLAVAGAVAGSHGIQF